MVDEVWLHIGTPKSGTSSLQKYLSDHQAALSALGLAYLATGGRGSANDLAIAWNNNNAKRLAELAGPLNAAIAERPEEKALISSEMFYGLAPDALYQMLPALRNVRLRVLVYLRRQDRYIEAKFLQKSKNARFSGSVFDYIEKFDGSGSDYAAELAPWEGRADARLIPRVMERGRLTGGDVVTDALAQIGVTDAPPVEMAEVNVSPGPHRVQLLQAANAANIAPPRRLQRVLAAEYPQDPADRGPVMSQAQRREYLARFDACNETLRARYFSDQDALFDVSDLDGDDVPSGIPAFTDAQLQEVTRLLKVIKKLA